MVFPHMANVTVHCFLQSCHLSSQNTCIIKLLTLELLCTDVETCIPSCLFRVKLDIDNSSTWGAASKVQETAVPSGKSRHTYTHRLHRLTQTFRIALPTQASRFSLSHLRGAPPAIFLDNSVLNPVVPVRVEFLFSLHLVLMTISPVLETVLPPVTICLTETLIYGNLCICLLVNVTLGVGFMYIWM